jgi:hypothetical protein
MLTTQNSSVIQITDLICSCNVRTEYVMSIFRRVCIRCEKRLLISLCPSACSHALARIPLHGFSWNLILDTFMKICRQTRDFAKNAQQHQALHMDTKVRLYHSQQYELFYGSTTVQRESTVAVQWQHWKIVYCWHLHVSRKQYKRNVVLRFNGNNS